MSIRKNNPAIAALKRADKARAEEAKAKAEAEKELATEKINGLGDLIKKATDFVGITQCDECKERQAKLNSLFPFIKKAGNLNEDDISFLQRIITANTIGNIDRDYIFSLYNRVMNVRLQPCQCPSVISDMRTKLWNIYLANHSTNINEN